ncbi:MAG: DUF4174 domain-containing protein [Litoreibacter sp.]|nr:DUF4174 domain-containing protein [Litoreibacter sp.]
MNPVTAFVFALFLTGPAVATDLSTAQEAPHPEIGPYNSQEVTLEEFLWLKRPVVVFADTPADPRFREQMALLEARLDALADRDVVILTDTDPAAKSALRMKLRPRGFMLVLIGKDGGVKLRKPAPWDVRELGRVIDKMPMRQQELRDRRKTGF